MGLINEGDETKCRYSSIPIKFETLERIKTFWTTNSSHLRSYDEVVVGMLDYIEKDLAKKQDGELDTNVEEEQEHFEEDIEQEEESKEQTQEIKQEKAQNGWY